MEWMWIGFPRVRAELRVDHARDSGDRGRASGARLLRHAGRAQRSSTRTSCPPCLPLQNTTVLLLLVLILALVLVHYLPTILGSF